MKWIGTVLLNFLIATVYGQGLLISQTVIREGGVKIKCWVDTANFNTVEIERRTTGNWYTLSTVSVKDPVFGWVDYTADTKVIYEYRLKSLTADGAVEFSNRISSILLTVDPKNHERVWLSWNRQTESGGEFSGYQVYRLVDGGSLNLIAIIENINDTVFVDNIISLNNTINSVCYQIRETQINFPVDFPDWMSALVSRSGLICVNLIHKALIPTAFNPNSPITQNQTFGINTRAIGKEGFSFAIYDRWGKLIFKANDPNVRWDGYVNGKLSQAGVYTYEVTYKTLTGLFDRQIGTFTLIK
jgi:gliding motility-associated-like protein